MAASQDRAGRRRHVTEAATRFAARMQLAGLEHARAAGLSLYSVDAVVLALLRVHGPLTPRELAGRAGVSSSGTITGAIDRLERAGWTARSPCRADRRKVFVTLTGAAPDDAGAEITAALPDLSDDELAAVAGFLDRVAGRAVPDPDGAGDRR